MRNKKIHLSNWMSIGEDKNRVKLIYSDNTILYVSTTDFNRAFGTILRCTKEEVERDFAIK